jgi:hypothetical protein
LITVSSDQSKFTISASKVGEEIVGNVPVEESEPSYEQARLTVLKLGIIPIPSRGGQVTNELVRRLLGEAGI